MTAPLFHLSPGALDGVAVGSELTLDGAEAHHAATVMRMGPGEEVLLSDTEHTRITAVILEHGAGELKVEVREVEHEPVEYPQLVLVQALAKDKRDLQAVESATELGVDRVIPWKAERSIARWKAGREAKKHAEWVNTAKTAAKQTRRTAVPRIEELHSTAQYVQRVDQQRHIAVVVLHETEHNTLQSAVEQIGDAQELHLLVGPEGGISETEIDQLVSAGAQPARLGRTVLRSSTAGPAALAVSQQLLGRWSR